MKFSIIVFAVFSAGYLLWSCKVRVDETSSVASSETELAAMEGVSCKSDTADFPKFSSVTLNSEHAALRFTLEDKTSSGVFVYRYFTHATKYYEPGKDTQYYAVRLGDNMVDFAANNQRVFSIYYSPNSGSPIKLNCI